MKLKHINFSGMGANCYLIDTDDVRIVIDPFDTHEEIDEFFTTDKPKYIFLTHFHFDHILGAKAIRDKHGAKIAIGKEDEIGLYNPEYSLCGMVGLTQEPFNADILFEDNDVFEVSNTQIKVLHIPGHTAGSVCYIIDNYMFTGDTLFQGTVGRTDLPTSDFATMKKSLDRLKNLEGDYKIFAGHGLATTLDRERKMNPYMV